MNKVTTIAMPDFRSRIEHDYEGEIYCDAPKQYGGQGKYISPTDLLAAALTSCVTTVLTLFCKKRGLDLTGLKVVCEIEFSPAHKILRMPVEIWMPIVINEADKAALENVASSCPVHSSLSSEIESPILFHWL